MISGSWMIGSCAFTCCDCSAPICTSCCCEIAAAADNPIATAAIAAAATNRLICLRVPSRLREIALGKGKTYSDMANRLLTLARDLRRRKARERQSLFVAEGVRTRGRAAALAARHSRACSTARNSKRHRRGTALLAELRRRGIAAEEVDDRRVRQRGRDRVAAGDSGDRARFRTGRSSDLASRATLLRLLVLDAVQDPETSARSSVRPPPSARRQLCPAGNR